MSVDTKVTLGDHEVNVYAQRHAYLTNKIAKYVASVMAAEADFSSADEVLSFFGDQVYDLLCVAIPTYGKTCPKYEFMGYGSQEALESGEYEEREDRSPTAPEVMEAFKVAAEVNRFDALKIVGKFVDPKLIKNWINVQVANGISDALESSPVVNAGSETSTTSGVTSPTSPEPEGSLMRDLKSSPTPISVGD